MEMCDEDKSDDDSQEPSLADKFLNHLSSSKLDSICVPCLLKVASKKEESEETQKEVEIALLALSNTKYFGMKREMYLNKIKAIIEYHQEHHNLTRLAYQSTWQFLVARLECDKSLGDAIINALHFTREAARE
ncbi:uncharacterized protein MONOS_18318 [Monocercomonoides exilis]|uniref:uncharacterized protein n=1 Tax=Monocercomonoides exilis TaxID=2049356 RepID=UPI00355A0178|nr:hypothetical protein MONOS_18318 [Monocercomonoides exilis]